jgi:hypothetical protein
MTHPEGIIRAHEDSPEAGRIWRALEMTHVRIEAMEQREEAWRKELPGLMKAAFVAAIDEVANDQRRRDAYWASGVNHIIEATRQNAGKSVIGLVWAGMRTLLVIFALVSIFGPAGVKTALSAWWKS